MSTRAKTLYSQEMRLFYASLSFLFLMFGLYVYFVSASIVHVIVRKELSQEIGQVNSHLSDLETEYIEAKNEVRADTLSVHGFAPIGERVFITKTPTSLVLSDNDES